MINLEIPDPFTIFASNRYKDYNGYIHNFFSKEWTYNCSACGEDLDAPSKKIMTKIRLYHTRNECLNGY